MDMDQITQSAQVKNEACSAPVSLEDFIKNLYRTHVGPLPNVIENVRFRVRGLTSIQLVPTASGWIAEIWSGIGEPGSGASRRVGIGINDDAMRAIEKAMLDV